MYWEAFTLFYIFGTRRCFDVTSHVCDTRVITHNNLISFRFSFFFFFSIFRWSIFVRKDARDRLEQFALQICRPFSRRRWSFTKPLTHLFPYRAIHNFSVFYSHCVCAKIMNKEAAIIESHNGAHEKRRTTLLEEKICWNPKIEVWNDDKRLWSAAKLAVIWNWLRYSITLINEFYDIVFEAASCRKCKCIRLLFYSFFSTALG